MVIPEVALASELKIGAIFPFQLIFCWILTIFGVILVGLPPDCEVLTDLGNGLCALFFFFFPLGCKLKILMAVGSICLV